MSRRLTAALGLALAAATILPHAASAQANKPAPGKPAAGFVEGSKPAIGLVAGRSPRPGLWRN